MSRPFVIAAVAFTFSFSPSIVAAQGPITQQAYVKASNTGAGDRFGASVSVSGTTMVVGASREDGGVPGVNGDDGDDSSGHSGAAYVFVRDGTSWTQQAYLKASSPGALDYFGFSVSISGDTVVVGAFGEDSQSAGVNGDQSDDSAECAGAAYVFVRDGTSWTQQAYLKASNPDAGDDFGRSVAVSGDTIVVGAPHEDSIARGVNGDQSDNNALHAGAAYVFVRNGTSWTQQAYLKAPNTVGGPSTEAADLFGTAVTIWGDTIVVGSEGDDSGATGIDGDSLNNDALLSGAAHVYVRLGNHWHPRAFIKPSNTDAYDRFGQAVSLCGDTLVVGGTAERSSAIGVNGDDDDNSSSCFAGAAYVFVKDGDSWKQEAYLKASNTDAKDYYGGAVSASGDVVVVGAVDERSNATGINGDHKNNLMNTPGAAYLYVRGAMGWELDAYVKASNTGPYDQFGRSVAVSGDTLAIGAWGEDGGATVINGDQGSDRVQSAGAVYAFDLAKNEFCFGDGGDQLGCTPCPCGNDAPVGSTGGCLNSAGASARLIDSAASASIATSDLSFKATGLPPNTGAFLVSGNVQAPSNPLNPCFGQDAGVPSVLLDGLRCVVQGVLLHGARPSDANGDVGVLTNGWGTTNELPGFGGFTAGVTRYFQTIYRDDALAVCTTGRNTSQALSVIVIP